MMGKTNPFKKNVAYAVLSTTLVTTIFTPFMFQAKAEQPKKNIQTASAGSIASIVFEDLDRDGVKDAGENGVAGATVELFSTSGEKVDEVMTDSTGAYTFTGLDAGYYYAKLTLPANFNYVSGQYGPSDLTSGYLNVEDGEETRLPAGLLPKVTGSIGDTVFMDTDRDGTQDPGELGASGVTVDLYDIYGDKLQTQQTDEDGHYLFEQLPMDTYYVRVNAPEGSIVSSSAIFGSDGTTAYLNLGNGQSMLNVDVGLQQRVDSTINSTVYMDANENGVRDTGEMGIEGVTMTIFKIDGTQVATTTTNASGQYEFNVEPGLYYMKVTPDNEDKIVPNELFGVDGFTGYLSIENGRTYTTFHAGVVVTAKDLTVSGPINAAVGETSQITANVLPVAAPQDVTYTSGNTSIATVNASGQVTAVGVGTTTITVRTPNDITKTVSVTVTAPVATSIDPISAINTESGTTGNITAVVKPSGASQVVTYTSNDTSVITVNQNTGAWTAVSTGTTTITVRSQSNTNVMRTVNVTVERVADASNGFLGFGHSNLFSTSVWGLESDGYRLRPGDINAGNSYFGSRGYTHDDFFKSYITIELKIETYNVNNGAGIRIADATGPFNSPSLGYSMLQYNMDGNWSVQANGMATPVTGNGPRLNLGSLYSFTLKRNGMNTSSFYIGSTYLGDISYSDGNNLRVMLQPTAPNMGLLVKSVRAQ